jgi:glycine/D-amino acid oxidase-like deaminating enzyme
MNRRNLLKSGAAAAFSAALACATRNPGRITVPGEPAGRKFARVQVSWDRIIRTVVGLRPFRPSGFVVRSERLGSKTVIHNYGHGGAGVTLSWGTSHLAVEEALKTGESRYAVIGCGAVGLASARLLQRRGFSVTIYARDLPPETTSNVAGAQWSPFSVADRDRRTPEFESRFQRAARLSHRYFQDMVGDYYGVRWIENYVMSDNPRPAAQHADPLQDLYPAAKDLPAGATPFAAPHVHRFVTMLIEPPVYLNAVLRDFLLSGGKLVVRGFDDSRQLAALDEPVIVNCSGLGARALFGDEELVPIKGQLSILLPQPEIDYITLGSDLYMFPRKDGILLGGTFERGEWSLDVNESERRRIVEGHVAFFNSMHNW